MADATTNLDAYHQSLESSRAWFRNHNPAVRTAFELLDAGFGHLGSALQVGRDKNNRTHVSLIPLLLVTQRQSFVAFDALSSMQAYQAWVTVRPGIEAALMLGKWIDNESNYHVWRARNEDPDKYRKKYQGMALESGALPNSPRIRESLSAINDLFVHPNPLYVFRHVEVREPEDNQVEIQMRFFDDDAFHRASVLSLLHLLVTAQTSIATMFAKLFVNIEVNVAGFGLEQFRSLHREDAAKALADSPELSAVVKTIGLWDLAGLT